MSDISRVHSNATKIQKFKKAKRCFATVAIASGITAIAALALSVKQHSGCREYQDATETETNCVQSAGGLGVGGVLFFISAPLLGLLITANLLLQDEIDSLEKELAKDLESGVVDANADALTKKDPITSKQVNNPFFSCSKNNKEKLQQNESSALEQQLGKGLL
jgi:hypothetical protein